METIQLDETHRLLVTEDESAEDPRTWGTHVLENGPTMQRWLNGEVYNVDMQERKTWRNVENPGDTLTTWETVDSIGGCYLDDEYTARVVAEEYFGLKREEVAL